MRCFWDERQRLHAPEKELHNGAFVPFAESPARADALLAALGPVEAPADFGEAPLRRVHSALYLDFLKGAWDEWRAAGRPGDAAGYVWPAVRRRPLALERVDAKLGLHSIDASTPVAEGTFGAAYWSTQSALAGLEAVLAGERRAFALCRPPGHHSGADYMGGYCYLNAAAVAAEAALAAGRKRVAILDVDYHHGNGTQDIFYARAEMLCVSVHADPRTDYPFFWGHADETGEGEGEGATLNLPLPRGTGWAGYAPALDRALERIAEFAPDLLIVSWGADTFSGDPISFFRLETADYSAMARRICSAGLPALIVMEGGYALDSLGANLEAFLSGF
jgi:acetoin utilization deacetylase AcuC-like enzyme